MINGLISSSRKKYSDAKRLTPDKIRANPSKRKPSGMFSDRPDC
jgi:hypothetical protein